MSKATPLPMHARTQQNSCVSPIMGCLESNYLILDILLYPHCRVSRYWLCCSVLYYQLLVHVIIRHNGPSSITYSIKCVLRRRRYPVGVGCTVHNELGRVICCSVVRLNPACSPAISSSACSLNRFSITFSINLPA